MNTFWYVMAIVLIPSIAFSVAKMRNEKRDTNCTALDEEKENYYSSLMEEDETLCAYCANSRAKDVSSYFVVTDRRIIIDDKKGLQSFTLGKIEKIKFTKYDGSRTTKPSDMSVITLKIDGYGKYTLARFSNKFETVAEELIKLEVPDVL